MPTPARRSQTASSLSDINVTPFVDVVLVLLVIFMITAPVLQSGIEVELPKTRTVKAITQARLVVTIDAQQRLYLGEDLIKITALGKQLQLRQPEGETTVYIRCDESVPFGIFATVMDTVRGAGIENISVVTEPLNRRRRS